MQQQMSQQEQCGSNQQQLGQPVMLCPVQYVYETPVMLPQPQEEQIQQNQIVINVKTPPPWIQNRPQNQVFYLQQIPNNYQPYIQPQMIQNHMYHPQMSYQIQPVQTQDNRQFIQIPNINQYNMVQNPTTQIIKEEADKMPLLTQMLNQKAIANKAPNVNNVRPNMTPTVNMIRPITHNQQVQTDNVSPNIKGRPRSSTPQIITINPMQQRQMIRKQETVMNIRPTNIRSDVPQHIRTKIPSSISVKSINNTRTIIRPFDAMSTPQNFYYDSNRNSLVMSVPTETRNIMTTTEQYLKPNIQEINHRIPMSMQYQIPVSNVPPFINMATVQNQGNSDNSKQIVNVNTTVQPYANAFKIQEDINKQPIPETKIVSNTEIETQTEEKLVRNTVFVQARGRVLNDKEVIQNQSIKRTFDDRLKEIDKEKQDTTLIVESKSPEEAIHVSKKIKLEVSDNSLENNKISNIPSGANMNIKTQQSRISNLQLNINNNLHMNTGGVQKNIIDKPEANKIENVSSDSNKLLEDFKSSKEQNILENASTDKETNSVYNSKTLIKMTDKVSNDFSMKEETKLDNIKKNEGKITVLTHVLEGYIIQESNIAFPIQKPSMEKDIKKEKSVRKIQDPKNAKTTKIKDKKNENHESKGGFPRIHIDSSIESAKEMEFAVVDKDNPFSNIKKTTVEKWTAEQLSSHLERQGWKETAAKLLDEEIDGESILLVNKDQLVAIGVAEEHAEVIVAFAAT